MKALLSYIFAAPHRLFLVDAGGALLSAVLLGLVLPRFEQLLGVPVMALRGLASVACILFLGSSSCALARVARWRLWLRVIAVANLAYCCLTLGLLLSLRDQVTLLGCAYFLGEVAVIVALASLELSVSRARR